MDAISAPTDLVSLALRLLVGTLLGGVIGLNRELLQKPAGLRTHALVSLGAALVALTSLLIADAPGDDGGAPGRIVQGVFAGIGFIGGGVILHRRQREVHGLTTAASIWMVAAVGTAVGFGLWRSAIIATALTLIVLVLGGPVDRVVRKAKANLESED
jgi:putative Mg2+ transporter-C (MgtC) family protein